MDDWVLLWICGTLFEIHFYNNTVLVCDVELLRNHEPCLMPSIINLSPTRRSSHSNLCSDVVGIMSFVFDEINNFDARIACEKIARPRRRRVGLWCAMAYAFHWTSRRRLVGNSVNYLAYILVVSKWVVFVVEWRRQRWIDAVHSVVLFNPRISSAIPAKCQSCGEFEQYEYYCCVIISRWGESGLVRRKRLRNKFDSRESLWLITAMRLFVVERFIHQLWSHAFNTLQHWNKDLVATTVSANPAIQRLVGLEHCSKWRTTKTMQASPIHHPCSDCVCAVSLACRLSNRWTVSNLHHWLLANICLDFVWIILFESSWSVSRTLSTDAFVQGLWASCLSCFGTSNTNAITSNPFWWRLRVEQDVWENSRNYAQSMWAAVF